MLCPVNTEKDLTVGEVIRDQVEAMSTSKYRLVACLFSQNSPVSKTSGQLLSYSPYQDPKAANSTRSKRKLDNENDLNVNNEITDQIVSKKESIQVYGPPILENLATAVKKYLETEARNESKNRKK